MSIANARLANTPSAAPDDVALPGAVLLQQPRRFIDVLSSGVDNTPLREWLGAGTRLVDGRVAIRRYVPGKRCIFELELVLARAGADALETRTVMGKLYSSGEGARVYDTLRRLWASGFSSGSFTVPRPLAYEPDCQLLLLSRVTGTALRQLLLAPPACVADDQRETEDTFRLPPSAEVSAAVERAAAWLMQLHTSGVTAGRQYTFDRHLHTLAHWQRRIIAVYPDATDPFGALLARIAVQGRALPAWEPAPTHRDFSPDHVVVDGTRLGGVDFDEFCQYDPLFDVAHFVAHLRVLGLTSCGVVQRFDELATRFQMAYQARAQEYSAARVRLYEAIAYLKLAHIIACIARPRGWQQTVATLLHEAQRIV